MKKIFVCAIIIGLYVLFPASNLLGQNKTPFKQIDEATWIWGQDSSLVRMRITVTSSDTIATYYHYKIIKIAKVHKFNLKKFLDSQKQ